VAFASDNFNRANASDRGANWTSVSSGNRTALDANESEGNNAGNAALEYYNPVTPGTAQSAQITLRTPIETGSSGGVGPAVYVQTGADSGYFVRCNTVAAQRFQLIRRIAGAETVLATYTGAAPAVGDVVRLEVTLDGSNDPVLDLFVNGTSVGTPFPFTDTNAAALTSGRVGDFGLIINDFARWDDWQGGDLGEVAAISGGGRGAEFWWYPGWTAMLLLTAAAGGGSDVVGTDSFSFAESAVAQLIPAATDSAVIAETATATVAVSASDTFTLGTEDAQVTTGAANLNSTDALTLSEALTTLQATLALSDSATLTDTLTTVNVVGGASDSLAISEALTAVATIAAADSFSLGEVATPTLISGNNIADSESFAITESATATLVATGVESLSLTDSAALAAAAVGTEPFILTESADLTAPFVGVARADRVYLLARLLAGTPSADAPSFDSTLITWDSLLTTFDGGYGGELADDSGVSLQPRQEGDSRVVARMAGTAGVV